MKKTLLVLLVLVLGLAWGQRLFTAIGVDPSRASIPIDEILSGGPPPQGIPALGFTGDWFGTASPTQEASFVSQQEASAWLAEDEPVIAFTVNGESKAYPLQILTWHEIVNDEVAGVPVTVTFCPLCNSALAFDRRIPLTAAQFEDLQVLNTEAVAAALPEDFLTAYASQRGTSEESLVGVEVSFGVSGMLYHSNMLMFDTASSTLWSQLLGEATVGTLTDVSLLRYPAPIVSFAEFRAAFPDSPVLSRETGFRRSYGRNPYVGYDDVNSSPFLFAGISDGRLPPKARVISIERLGESVAYPFEILTAEGVVNDSIADLDITLFWKAGTASALDGSSIAGSNDVGAVGVFSRTIDGQLLTFESQGEHFVDLETGSSWNLLGQATAGELAGKQLEAVVHDNTLWFAWAAFMPETRLYTGG